MATPPGSFDSLEALDAAAPASEPPPASAAATAPLALPPTGIVWGVNGEPSAACPASYITADDSLVITVWNSNSALTSLTAQVRVLRPDGGVQIQQFPINNLPSDRSAKQVLFGQMEGLILAVTIGPPNVPLVRGQTYVQLAIFRGEVSSPIMQQVFVSDYVTSAFQPGWPYGRVLPSSEGAGYAYTALGPTPLLGAECVLFLPTNARWRVGSIVAELHTSAVAGNRQVSVFIQGGAGSVYGVQAPAVQTANTDVTYTLGATLPLVASGPSAQLLPLPGGLVLGGLVHIQTTTVGLLGGDQYNKLSATVEEWIDT